MPSEIHFQLVEVDGCYIKHGMRVRAGPGNGMGSLEDERERGIVTPLCSEHSRGVCLGLVGRDMKAFVRELPAVVSITNPQARS